MVVVVTVMMTMKSCPILVSYSTALH